MIFFFPQYNEKWMTHLEKDVQIINRVPVVSNPESIERRRRRRRLAVAFPFRKFRSITVIMYTYQRIRM